MKRLNLIDSKPDSTNTDIDTGGIDKESCEQQLKRILSTISKYGEIAVSGIGNKYLPDICGLHINGVGNVPLPLCSLVANAIFNLPHCKKVSTHHTESKQNDDSIDVYEIDSEQFKFENNKFSNGISKLVNKVGYKLGICTENLKYISYDQHKLCIFDSNGHPLLYRGNKNQSPKFARVVVQLPSRYSMVNDNDAPSIVKYDNQIFEHYLGCDDKLNEYHCHYESFYYDLMHTTNKIKNGYRVCVIYELCWNKPSFCQLPNVSKLNETQNNICNLLRLWDDENNNVITLELKHSYNKHAIQSTGINCFKGIDKERAWSLIKAAKYLETNDSIGFGIGCRDESGSGYPAFNYNHSEFFHQSYTSYDDRRTYDWYTIDGTPWNNNIFKYDSDEFRYLAAKSVLVIWKKKYEFSMICKKGGVEAGLKEVETEQMYNTHETKMKLCYMVNVFDTVRDNSSMVTLLQTLINRKEYRIACYFITTKLCCNSNCVGLNCNGFDHSAGIFRKFKLMNEIINLIKLCGWPEYKDTSPIMTENENKIDNTIKNKSDNINEISILCRGTILKLLNCVTLHTIKNVADYCEFVSKLVKSHPVNNHDHLVADITHKFSDALSTRYQLFDWKKSGLIKSESCKNTLAVIQYICMVETRENVKVGLLTKIHKILCCGAKKGHYGLVERLCKWQCSMLASNQLLNDNTSIIFSELHWLINDLFACMVKDSRETRSHFLCNPNSNIQKGINMIAKCYANNNRSINNNECTTSKTLIHGYLRIIAKENSYIYDFTNLGNIVYQYYDKSSLITSLLIKPKCRMIVQNFNPNLDANNTLIVLDTLNSYHFFDVILEFVEKKLCVMGLDHAEQSYPHQYKGKPSKPQRSNNIDQFLLTLLAYKWCNALKDVMTKLMNSFIMQTHPYRLSQYYEFCMLLFKNIKKCNSDTVGINKQCATDVAHALSIAIGIKYGLLRDNNSGINKSFSKVTVCEILLMLKHLILHEKDLNLQKYLLSKFAESYSECVKEPIQESVITKLLHLQSSESNENDQILSDSCIQYLFKQRLKYLEHIIEQGKPEFTWKISKLTTIDSEMKEFLIREARAYRTEQGKFATIQLAKDWIVKKEKKFNEYLRFTPSGSGKKSYVTVTKTKKHFHEMTRKYEKYVRQHNAITALITQ